MVPGARAAANTRPSTGRALGPLVIAGVLAAVGLAGSWLAIVPGIAVSIVLVLRLAGRPALQLRHPTGSIRRALTEARRAFVLLAATAAFGAMARVGLSVFIPTYLTQAGAGIVLLHHMPGWDEFYRETARRMAQHGYLTICPNLYARLGTGTPDDATAQARSAGAPTDDSAAGAAAGAGAA